MTSTQLLRSLRGLVEGVDRGAIDLERLPHEFGMLVRRFENSADIPETEEGTDEREG